MIEQIRPGIAVSPMVQNPRMPRIKLAVAAPFDLLAGFLLSRSSLLRGGSDSFWADMASPGRVFEDNRVPSLAGEHLPVVRVDAAPDHIGRRLLRKAHHTAVHH